MRVLPIMIGPFLLGMAIAKVPLVGAAEPAYQVSVAPHYEVAVADPLPAPEPIASPKLVQMSYDQAMRQAGQAYFIVCIDCDPPAKRDQEVYWVTQGPWNGVIGPALVISRNGEWLETRRKVNGQWMVTWRAANQTGSAAAGC